MIHCNRLPGLYETQPFTLTHGPSLIETTTLSLIYHCPTKNMIIFLISHLHSHRCLILTKATRRYMKTFPLAGMVHKQSLIIIATAVKMIIA